MIADKKLNLAALDQGKRLATIRAARGFTRTALEGRARVTAGSVSYFEAGSFKRLRPAERYRICEVLSVRYDDIFEDTTDDGA